MSAKRATKVAKDKPFAVLSAGGKQYIVQEGQKLRLGKVAADEGQTVTLESVLLVGSENEDGSGEVKVGKPTVAGAKVSLKVLKHGKDKKVIIFKKKRRKGYTKKQGHRQEHSDVLVEQISF